MIFGAIFLSALLSFFIALGGFDGTTKYMILGSVGEDEGGYSSNLSAGR